MLNIEKPEKKKKPEKDCYQRAGDLLSRRAHFSAELHNKLRQRGFEPDDIEQTLDRLTEQGYLNDSQTTQLWLEQQLARKPQGGRKLFAGLLRRGVDADLAQQWVQELVEPEEKKLAQEAAERWLARSPNGKAAGLARHLERLGFATHISIQVVQGAKGRLTA